jgi:soluble lytic murein transglycosylase-like protein
MNTIVLLFILTSIKYNLPPGLLKSLCYVESKHNIASVSINDGGSDSIGICQVKLKTAKWLGFEGNEKELLKPEYNIEYAGKYLKYQIDRYDSTHKGIIAYNRGNSKGLTSTTYLDKVINQWKEDQKWRKIAKE